MPETTKACQVEMADGKPCGRELWGGGRCIFHSQNEDKDAKLFQKQLDEILQDESLKTYDFTHFIFPDEVVFPKKFSKPALFGYAEFKGWANFMFVAFEGGVNFLATAFKGKASFMGTSFAGGAIFSLATFESEANFAPALFKGEADFQCVTFKGEVNVGKAIFERKADFKDTAFKGNIKFLGASFKGAVNFRGATFEEEADYSFVTFEGDTYFWEVRFKDYAHFTGAAFKGYTGFGGTIFKGDANFGSSAFEGNAAFTAATFEEALVVIQPEKDQKKTLHPEVDFRWVTFSKPEKVEFRKADLSRFRFLGTDVRKVDFTDVKWYRQKDKGRNRAFDEVSPAPDPKNPNIKKFDYELIGKLYRQLRANYEENLRYSEAGDFYMGEMEMTKKAQTSIFKKLPLLFYKTISNYGESYYRPLGWIAAILLIFPLLFMFAGIEPVSLDPNNPIKDPIHYKLDFNSTVSFLPSREKIGDYYTSFLYSMSVFSFIRDKKYTTIDNWGHTLFVLESILSPVTLAFFLLALRRRFKR